MVYWPLGGAVEGERSQLNLKATDQFVFLCNLPSVSKFNIFHFFVQVVIVRMKGIAFHLVVFDTFGVIYSNSKQL